MPLHTHRPRKPPERAKTKARGYGGAWRRLRRVVLRKALYQCALCGRRWGRGDPPMEVDHIRPLAAGGTNHYDNLQALCKACHSKKTVREDGGLGR